MFSVTSVTQSSVFLARQHIQQNNDHSRFLIEILTVMFSRDKILDFRSIGYVFFIDFSFSFALRGYRGHFLDLITSNLHYDTTRIVVILLPLLFFLLLMCSFNICLLLMTFLGLITLGLLTPFAIVLPLIMLVVPIS